MKVKLVLEYDGACFAGWQQQPGFTTIQGVIQKALGVYLQSLSIKTRPVGDCMLSSIPVVTGSGRTDSGVHALGQVASFSWPDHLPFDAFRLCRSLDGIARSMTPERHALIVRSAEPMPDEFDARFSPHHKYYRYYLRLMTSRGGLWSHRAWSVGSKLNFADMQRGAELFVGRKDFIAFRARDCNARTTVRHVFQADLTRVDDDLMVFSVSGNGFLKQMIRIMIGTLVDIGKGVTSLEHLRLLLASETRESLSGIEHTGVKDPGGSSEVGGGSLRALAGATAPAHGLVLYKVVYY